MGNDEHIVETIKEEVADAAKAVVADVKAIVHEVADVISEGVCGEHPHHIRPPSAGRRRQGRAERRHRDAPD